MPNLGAAFNTVTTTAVGHSVKGDGTAYDDNGYAVPAFAEPVTIRASIQPIPGKEFENLPEGIRQEAKAKIITQVQVKPGDRIIDDAARYKVLSIDDWQKLGGYTRGILGALR